MCSHTLQKTGVFGLHSRQPCFLSVYPTRQNRQNQERVSASAQQRQGIGKDTCSHHWPIIFSRTCGSSGSIALSRFAASEVSSFTAVRFEKRRLRHHSAPQPGGSTGFNMVDRVFLSGRTTSQMASSDSNNRVRRIEERLGSSFNSSAADYRRDLESRRSSTPHQLEGCLLGSASICTKPFQCPHPSADGQHGCYSVLESFRRNQILHSLSTSDLSLGLVSAERDHSTCRSSTRTAECKSRLCFQELER